jgi:hypothetical protein
MHLLSGALLASALAAAPLLPAGAPVVFRAPDVAAELREFEPSPPAWSADVVNALYGEGTVAVVERQSGWLSNPARWELVDYVDRAYNYQTHGWLARRGIAAEHYGYNEFQETLALLPDGAVALLGERGLARGLLGELVPDPNMRPPGRGFIADPLEPRWAAMLGYDQAPSPLLADALSQDNLSGPFSRMGPGSVGHFGDANARGFAAWRAAHGETPVPDLRAYARAHVGALFAQIPPYAAAESFDARRAWAAAQAICDDPVLADHQVFLNAANLQVFTRLYTNLRQVATRAGRAYDVHGNLGAGMMGMDVYSVVLGLLVDTPWGEGGSSANVDLFQHGFWNAWSSLRLEMTVALAGDRAVQFMVNPENRRTPDLLAHELAENGAGGSVPLVNPDLLARDAPQSLPVFDEYLRFRDAHRALYLPGGRTRIADVGLLYSVATFLFDPCIPGASSTDTPPLNDFSGAARALEDLHLTYDAVILPHPELASGRSHEPDLSRYTLLVAPSLERLSDADLARLARWLRGGGTLAVLGRIGVRDERNQPRARDALAELRAAGKVRVLVDGASLPAIRTPLGPDGRALTARVESELGALVADPVVGGELPATTWVKTWRHAGGFASVHFVNYAFDAASGSARATVPARVRLRLPADLKAETARWLVPGEPERELELRRDGRAVELELPALRVHGVLVLGPAGAEARASALARGDRRLARARMAGAGASDLEPRLAAVQSLRSSDPQKFDRSAGTLLRALSSEREAAYLGWIRSLADWGEPVAAFAFGQQSDEPPWKAVAVDTDYLPQLGYGWLPADDDSRASPEDRDYGSTKDVDADALMAAPLAAVYWPYSREALPKPVASSIVSGRPRRFRVDLPDGDYRVSVVSANASYHLASMLVSGMVVANGRPALLDVPLGKGALVRRAFTAHVEGGALEFRFGGATGFGVAALVIEKASALEPDPLEDGAIRDWRISERHPNPDWAPLRDVSVPDSPPGVALHAAEQGIPLVDLGTLAQAEVGDVVTATAELERASAGTAELSVGASSAARVYLNGRLVLELANLRGVERDEGIQRVALVAGTNRLEIVLERFWERRWLFYASLH